MYSACAKATVDRCDLPRVFMRNRNGRLAVRLHHWLRLQAAVYSVNVSCMLIQRCLDVWTICAKFVYRFTCISCWL